METGTSTRWLSLGGSRRASRKLLRCRRPILIVLMGAPPVAADFCGGGFLLPRIVGTLAESGDNMTNVLFCNFRLALFDQVDDALMAFNVLAPDGCILPRRENADACKRK